MVAAKPIERKVYFFQLQRRGRKTMKHIPSSQYFSWKQILEEYGNVPWEKHWFEDKRYCLMFSRRRNTPYSRLGKN